MAHVIRNRLLGDTPRADFTEQDISLLHKWAGVIDGIWTDVAEEKFARGFERYIRSGKSPTNKLDEVFRKLSRWMKKVYSRLKGSPIDIKISPEMRAFFDKLVAPGLKAPTATADVDAIVQGWLDNKSDPSFYTRRQTLVNYTRRLAKRLSGWKSADQLTVKDRDGSRDGRRTADTLKELVDAGLI